MKSRIFLFLAIISVAGMLAMSGCHREDDEQNGRNGRNGSTTGTFSGHDWVDLGLPSGTLWATYNVGANSPEEYGYYFAWGETMPKDFYDAATYKYCKGDWDMSNGIFRLTKYCCDAYYGYNGFTDNLTTLEASDDAATANWGSGWRMPASEEVWELNDCCTRVWTTQNGVNGCLFTGPNGNSIFLPAAGYYAYDELKYNNTLCTYWTNSTSACDHRGLIFLFDPDDYYNIQESSRCYGLSVRPVRNR